MHDVVKIVHLLCLFGGGASMIGNAILSRNLLAEGGPPEQIVVRSMRTLGMIGLGSVVLLWVTGIWLVLIGYAEGGGPGWAFYVKIAGATLVLGASATISILSARAGIEGRLPNPDVIRPLAVLTHIGATVAVVFAVIAFG